jgi:hypothetical protein
MTGYLDADHVDLLNDHRAEHASLTGEPMTLAEALRRLVTDEPTADDREKAS